MNGTFSVSSTPVAITGNSAALDLVSRDAQHREHAPTSLAVLLSIGAVTGTGSPSLTVEVQWSNDGVSFVSATTADTFTAITATGTALKQFTVKGRYARLKYTVAGTNPSFPLDASGYAA